METKLQDCVIALDISNDCVKTCNYIFLKHIYSLCSSDPSSVMNCFKLENELLALVSGWIIILKVTFKRKQIFGL